MKLLTKEQIQKLKANFEIDDLGDYKPLVKLFTPDAQAVWLLIALKSDNDIAFGLCDLGLGLPELGYVSLSELATVRGRFGLPVERDRHFTATKTLKQYAEEARRTGRIQA